MIGGNACTDSAQDYGDQVNFPCRQESFAAKHPSRSWRGGRPAASFFISHGGREEEARYRSGSHQWDQHPTSVAARGYRHPRLLTPARRPGEGGGRTKWRIPAGSSRERSRAAHARGRSHGSSNNDDFGAPGGSRKRCPFRELACRRSGEQRTIRRWWADQQLPRFLTSSGHLPAGLVVGFLYPTMRMLYSYL